MGAFGNRTLSDLSEFLSEINALASEKKSTQIVQSAVAERALYEFDVLVLFLFLLSW
jgi:hypothetical protein